MSAIRSLATGEHTLIGDIIGDSFADDPVNNFVFTRTPGLSAYYTLIARKLYLRQGYGHVAGNDGGALWLPPGISKDIPLWRSLDIAMTMTRHCGLSALLRGMRVDDALCARKPRDPHYYLFAIGARQGRQGKGVGGRLMAAGLEHVDAAGMPAYLESSKESNVPFYRRFGFQVMEQVRPTPDCPPLWLMWREAR
jgi:ribosomal protein S18 acetylase RimI-like enzyme